MSGGLEIDNVTIPYQSHMAIMTWQKGKEQMQATASQTFPQGID